MQRRAELVQRQRLHVPFDISRGLRGIAFGKGAQLRWRHGQRPGPVKRVFDSHRRSSEQAVRALVQGADVPDLVDDAHLEVIMQVLAHAGQIVLDVDAVLLQQRCRADAG